MNTGRRSHTLTCAARSRPAFAGMLCAAFILTGIPLKGHAQEDPVVKTGSRVRITSQAMGPKGAVGTVQDITAGALVVQFHNPRRQARVERGEITAMDVSVGRERKALRGMGTGALVGGGAGFVMGFMSGDDPPECWLLCYTKEEKGLIMAVFLGGSGAVIGLITGALTRGDVWSPAVPGSAPLPDLRVTPVPGRDGTAVRVGLSFRIR